MDPPRPGLGFLVGVFFAWFATHFVTIYLEIFRSLRRKSAGLQKGLSDSRPTSVGPEGWSGKKLVGKERLDWTRHGGGTDNARRE
jgi:hypothetical protein